MQRRLNALVLTVLLFTSGEFLGERASIASNSIRPTISCPATLNQLVPLLLRDLPAYTNRVTQRTFEAGRSFDRPGHVLIAGAADYTPLPVEGQFVDDDVQQVFFTTLERQYVQQHSVTIQTFHWAFLTQTPLGWRLVLMFSQIQPQSGNLPPLPPVDSSQGSIAQAIQLWLRDCQAGAVPPAG